MDNVDSSSREPNIPESSLLPQTRSVDSRLDEKGDRSVVTDTSLVPDTSDSDKSLDTVRQILFGEQVRVAQEKQASLERLVRISGDALREEYRLKINEVKHEISLLAERMDDLDQQNKVAAVTAQEQFDRLEQGIERLDGRMRSCQDEMQQRLLRETEQLAQQMNDWRNEMLERLQQARSELQHNKTDRKLLAGMLEQMASQLQDDAEFYQAIDGE